MNLEIRLRVPYDSNGNPPQTTTSCKSNNDFASSFFSLLFSPDSPIDEFDASCDVCLRGFHLCVYAPLTIMVL